MSFGNIIAALGSAAGGYMAGTRERQQMQMAQNEEDYKQWQRQQAQAEAERANTLRSDLEGAAVPVSMQTAGGKPATQDDIDVGQPGEAAPTPNTYAVGDKSFTDSGAAQKALGQANSPAGQAQRISQAYLKNGQAGMALQVQKDAQQSELAQLGLDEKHRQAADEMFDRQLQQQPSHEAIAKYVSAAPGDGQGGSLKVQAVVSPDGKSVTYNRVGDDGSLTPLSDHTYENSPKGVADAQSWLSRTTPLKDKLANIRQGFQDEQSAKKTDAEIQEMKDRGEYYRAVGAAAGVRADKTGTGKASLYDRMDEVDKVELQGTQAQAAKLQETIDNGIAQGTIKEGDDAFKQLNNRLVALQLKARNIIKQYSGDDGNGADPLGLRPGGGSPALPDGGASLSDPNAASADFSGVQGANRTQILTDIAAHNPNPYVRLRAKAALQGGMQAVAAAPAAASRPNAMGAPGTALPLLMANKQLAAAAEQEERDKAQRYADSVAAANQFAQATRLASMQGMSHAPAQSR